MSVGQSDHGGNEGNIWTVGVGVLGLVIGVGAIILANATKLTSEKVLLGGAYVADGYRNALLVAGIVLVALSLIVIVLSAITTVDQRVLSTIKFCTGLLLLGTAIGGGVIYAAYRHEENVLAANGGSATSALGSLGSSSVSSTSAATPAAVTCPDGSPAPDFASCPATTTDTSTQGSVNGIPTQTGATPIQVDCPLSPDGHVENHDQPSSCFWVVGPGTGAEQSAPPNPKPGANYNYDVGSNCTWSDGGQNAEGVVELYTCT